MSFQLLLNGGALTSRMLPIGVARLIDSLVSKDSLILGYNPSLWLDASDASTITESGGLVSQWDDKSGNGNHATQLTGSKQPSYTNGSITFNADAFNCLSIGSGTNLDLSTELTIFCVLTIPTGVTLGYVLARNELSATDIQYGILFNLGYIVYLDGAQRDANATGLARDIKQVISVRYNSATAEAFINGTSNGSSIYTGALPSAPNMFIGARSNSADGSTQLGNLTATIHEIIIYGKDAVPARRSAIENYLFNKWGI